MTLSVVDASVWTLYAAWTLQHAELLRVTWRDRRMGAPPLVMPSELAWCLYGALFAASEGGAASVIAWVWAGFAVLNTWLLQRWGREEFLLGLPPRLFWPVFAAATAACWAVLAWTVPATPEGWRFFHQTLGPLGTLLWSIAFPFTFLRRRGLAGHSTFAWVVRFFGSSLVLLALGVHGRSLFLAAVGAGCALADLAYLALHRRRVSEASDMLPSSRTT
ncbi:MAG: hypothetical protein SF051_04345 [Elusimicrobiota bacterium]|nr:hypothetical protein [Elusimicrobiota bacterium]